MPCCLVILALILVIHCSPGKSQPKFTDDLQLRLSYHYGFVLPEYSLFTYLVHDPVRSAELSLSKETSGKTVWEQLYNYPEYGISLYYSTLGNDKVFGREVAVYPHFTAHYISTERFDLDNKVGMGLGYVTKRFDLEENFRNIAVGSRLNIHFSFELGARYRLALRTEVHAGLAFNHFSNANSAEPNLGINWVTAYGGLSYRPGNLTEHRINEIPPHKRETEFALLVALGAKSTRALTSDRYLTSSISFELNRKVWPKFHFGIGPDLFFDSSTETEMEALSRFGHKGIYDFRTGIHISQEIVYNRFSLILQEGVYLLLTDKVGDNIMYNRAILRYKVTKKFLVNFAMKSHLHILDYPELGIGMYW